MLIAAAVLEAPDDPSRRGLLVVVAAVLVVGLLAAHVRLLLRVAPGPEGSAAVAPGSEQASEPAPGQAAEPPVPVPAPAAREPVDAVRG